MKSVLDCIELQVLRKAGYLKYSNILGESHFNSYGTLSVFHIGQEIGWADSLYSVAFATRWNPKHPSYVSTLLFCSSITQLCCGEQTIWDVQAYWQVKYQANIYLRKIYTYFSDINKLIYPFSAQIIFDQRLNFDLTWQKIYNKKWIFWLKHISAPYYKHFTI